MEVKSFIQETTEMYLYSNYSFYHSNVQLNEYMPFESLNVDEQMIEIRYGKDRIQTLLKKSLLCTTTSGYWSS